MDWITKHYDQIMLLMGMGKKPVKKAEKKPIKVVPKEPVLKTPYEWALTQRGTHERTNPKQVQKYLATVKMGEYDPNDTAWCAAFVNWCVVQSGIVGTGKPNARSFLKLGVETKTPQKGDIVIFWRESIDSWKGHVAFFHSYTAHGQVICLGGNQDNCVCLKTYSANRVLGYRKLEK